MENKSHVIAAVVFILVFGVGAVVFFFWLRPDQSASRTYQTRTGQSVDGLTAQSPVKFKGLKVGHIESVDFAPDDPNTVRIVFVVGNRVPVTQSSYAELSGGGIVGLKSLNLSNPDPKAKPLETDSEHPAKIPLHQGLLSELEDSGKQSMRDVNAILDSVQRLLNADNRKHLARIMAQIDRASANLVAAEKAAQPALAQLPALTRQLEATITQIHELATRAKQPVAQAGQVEDSAQALSASARRLVQRLNDDTLPRIDDLAETLNQTANHLDKLSRELSKKPQSIIVGPPEPKPGPGEPGFQR